jgi:hypothetical protein
VESEKEYLKKCLDLLLVSRQELQGFKSKQVRLLQLKIACSMCVFSIKTGNQEFYEIQKEAFVDLLNSQRDAGQREFEVRAAVQLILNSVSLEAFAEDIESDLSDVRERVTESRTGWT